MSQRRIFITGCSTGLGRAATKLFSSQGWSVVATMRRPEAETELANLPNVSLLALDVTKPAQIEQAAKQAIAGGAIDTVFNNAGYGLAGPVEGTTDEQITSELDTNLRGAIQVTRAFIGHFRERRAGTFLTTTSIGGLITFPFNSIYHATKWALEGFNESLAFELAPFGIRVKTISPGGIKTDFVSRSMVFAQHPAYADLVARAHAVFSEPERAVGQSTPEQIADVVYEAATDGKDQLRYVAGADAKEMHAQRLAAGDEAFRKAMAKQFFG